MTENNSYDAGQVDVVVVGAGHAGCEAALAAVRLGCTCLLLAIHMESIAMMPCNPNIGGTSKGHLVREIDALGGEMGINIDKSYIQSRMLNKRKGPAVHSLRAQADKKRYSQEMRNTLEAYEGLQLRQGEVVAIRRDATGQVTGVQLRSGAVYRAKAVILATGTYLNARCLYGDTIEECGPAGYMAARALSQSLRDMGVSLLRFKTGTPARVDKRSLDFSQMEIQEGDPDLHPFSFTNRVADIQRPQIPCYLTYTNEETHKIIRENLHRSPLYTGIIEGAPTRYCPSIEDKVVRFADKDRHQVFVEPEGEDTVEMYVQGMSTSLPEDVQVAMYRTMAGFANCRIIRAGYAIEYDCLDATQLQLSLQFKDIPGLFAAGQLNGSSGYEEAAAQGFMAGINAARWIKGQEPFVLDRSEGYIGVLIDDLVTKGTREPYRMMTSRAEYRLLLRQDNADERLTAKGYELGLISENRYGRFLRKMALIEEEVTRLENTVLSPGEELNAILTAKGSAPVQTGVTLAELVRRPEITYGDLDSVDANRTLLPDEVTRQVNIRIKYAGYIKRQREQIDQFKKMEVKKLPPGLDYSAIHGLRLEARQKLAALKPENLGQAARITGVSPADISVLMVALEAEKRKKNPV